MILPAGVHKVEFKFEPKAFFIGEKISMISSIIILLILLTGIVLGARNMFATKA